MTVRNIPEGEKQEFRKLAAAHGRSMEEQLRQLISQAVHAYGARKMPDTLAENRNWVADLIQTANGAGEGVFESEPQLLREFDL